MTGMGRNLYILAATLLLFAMTACGAALTHLAQSGGDRKLWHTMGMALFVGALLVALGATLTTLFEQAERRVEEAEHERRRKMR